jgi:hypothetical protein
MKLTKLKISAVALFLILVGSIGSMDSSTPFVKAAHAQPGSRLCGYVSTTTVPVTTTTTGPGAMAIVLEARQNGVYFWKWCDKIISETSGQIQADALLKTMSWTQVRDATCESVGQYLVSGTWGSADICDNMSSWGVYKIRKTTSTNSTIFERTKTVPDGIPPP